MSRKSLGPCPSVPPLSDEARWPGYQSETYRIELVTPMFGGGPEAGHLDPVTLINPKAIRGDLRFWWRATRGALCASSEDLFRREEEIFGSTEFPNSLIVEVDVPEWLDRRSPRTYYGFERYGPEAYALFSAKQNVVTLCKEGLQFSLTLRWALPEQLKRMRQAQNDRRKRAKKEALRDQVQEIEGDIKVAMWAWVNFGGIGARTRRGCGSLRCEQLSPSSGDRLGEWFNNSVEKYQVNLMATRQWPTLSANLWTKGGTFDPVSAWSEAIRPLREFRQGNVGRLRGRGRSFWPEPDAVRRTTRQHLNRNKVHAPDPNKPEDAFPRAAFGLPIIFHFKDRDGRNPQAMDADPDNTQLYPVANGTRRTRMASPLILKALAVGSDKAIPLIMSLSTAELENVHLVRDVNDPSPLNTPAVTKLRGAKLAVYSNSPMGAPQGDTVHRSKDGSALEAFLAYAEERENDFKRVNIP